MLKEYQPRACIVVFDSKSPTFRKEIDPRYKANRPPPPEDISAQIEAVRKLCEAAEFPVLQSEGVEADDWIASFAHFWNSQKRVVIVSTDKDLTQLINENTVLYDAYKDKIIAEPEVKEKWGVRPDQMGDLLSLTGDSSDNIPGVAGVGPKTAATLINDFGSIDEILKNTQKLSPKLREKIEKSLDDLKLSQRLVALKDDLDVGAIPVTPLTFPLKPALKDFLVDWDCKRVLDNYGDLFLDRPAESAQPAKAEPAEVAAGPVAVQPGNSSLELVKNAERLAEIESAIRGAGLVVIDVETDSFRRFESKIVGVALAYSSDRAFYLPWRHHQSEPSSEDVFQFLKRILQDPQISKIAHNLKFDAQVLSREGLLMTGTLEDTMIEGYLLHADHRSFSLDALSQVILGETKGDLEALLKGSSNFADIPLEQAVVYSGNDAHLTFKLHQQFRPKILQNSQFEWLYRELEMPFVAVITEMERVGISVDVNRLKELSKMFHSKMDKIQHDIFELAGEKFNIQSPKQLQKILFEKLKLQPTKKTKTGFSTDESVLQDLSVEHPLPAQILEFRGLSKLTSTYVDVLPDLIDSNGRIHTHYHQTGTVTGRLSSSDPNLQNIPARSEDGLMIRSAFVAPSGCVLMSADYSQVELRIFAHMSGDENLIAAFRSGRDIHSETARVVFGTSDREYRERAKAINYGIVYGISAFGLSKQLKIGVKDASQFMEAYFSSFPKLKDFMKGLVDATKRNGYTETLFGRRRPMPDINSQNAVLRQMSERMSMNAPVQGTAADIMKSAMVRIAQRLQVENFETRMLLQVHDELVLEVPTGEIPAVQTLVSEEMSDLSNTPLQSILVPLVVDISIGSNWAELK